MRDGSFTSHQITGREAGADVPGDLPGVRNHQAEIISAIHKSWLFVFAAAVLTCSAMASAIVFGVQGNPVAGIIGAVQSFALAVFMQIGAANYLRDVTRIYRDHINELPRTQVRSQVLHPEIVSGAVGRRGKRALSSPADVINIKNLRKPI